jgi:GT2 family glycosyltransferase
MARRLAVVVLNYRTPEETVATVRSIAASAREPDDLVVVDNDPHDVRLCDAVTCVSRRVRYVATGRNVGYSAGMNAGIRAALDRDADAVLLSNSDVTALPETLGALETLMHASSAGIVGPMVLERSNPGKIASLGMSYSRTTGRMRHRAFDEPVDRYAGLEDELVDGVSGCFMLVDARVFVRAGLLSEDYFFSFEDLEFCLRARRRGFVAIRAGRAFVYHEGGRSIGPTSPARLYFAARNHLRLARDAAPQAGPFTRTMRTCSILALNVAHAVREPGAPLPVRLAAVVDGIRDYAAGRFGSGRYMA